MLIECNHVIGDLEALRTQVLGHLVLEDGAEQMALLVGGGRNYGLGAGDGLCGLFELLAFKATLLGAQSLGLGDCLYIGVSGRLGKALRKKIISGIAVGYVNYVAQPAEFIHVISQQYLHLHFSTCPYFKSVSVRVTVCVGQCLRSKRQKRHKPCVFYGPFDFALAAGTVAAALARIYLAAMRQQLLQGLDILVIHVFLAPPAKPALGLLRRRQLTGVVRPVVSSFASFASSVVSSFAKFRHIFTSMNNLGF
jgi:hypothetical protein